MLAQCDAQKAGGQQTGLILMKIDGRRFFFRPAPGTVHAEEAI